MTGQEGKMKLPRSLRFYVAASTFYAAVIFFGVQFIYTLQLAESGLLVARRDSGDVLASIQVVSFVVWLGISLIAGVIMHRLATALAGARSSQEQRDQELGAIFGLSASLAGPTDLEEIGGYFVTAVRGVLSADVTLALIVYDDVLEAFRTVAADGPHRDALHERTYSASELPALIRTRVIDHRQALVLSDTAKDPDTWAKLGREMPSVRAARSFSALPLVSRERLVGALLLLGDRPGALDADRVQVAVMMGQYIAGSIHTALSMKDAEARAEREALVNRIAQRARASLDPQEIVRGTIEELARVLGVSRVLLCVGAALDDLAVSYEWDAADVTPVGVGARNVPIARLAARLGRTVVVSDVRTDRRFADALGPGDVASPDVIAAAATPVRVGGQLAGAHAFSHVDRAREWTADDIRLMESVAQELRVAVTAAEAYGQQRLAVAELERLNRAKSDFVSIVSHEFRTPLTGIQGFSEMMRSEDLTLAEMREYAGDINKDAQRLNRMINEMLDLDKMESGRMQLHREPVDFNAVVRDAVEHVGPNAPAHRLVLRLDPLLTALTGDHDKLTQVLTNLLNNAVKYSPQGGEIVMTTRREGEAAHLLVRDHGIGIPAEALETIFHRYGRVESGATRNIQGTGLGLPIVRQIVQLHGGAVWAESTVGKGSVFHVTLPLGASGRAVAAVGATA
jgi:signal transduction histidine kinase